MSKLYINISFVVKGWPRRLFYHGQANIFRCALTRGQCVGDAVDSAASGVIIVATLLVPLLLETAHYG